MGTIDKYAMRSILAYLDGALIETAKTDSPTLESQATWCVRMARDRLLDAALAGVTVELEAV
jgi:hypothetical protein